MARTIGYCVTIRDLVVGKRIVSLHVKSPQECREFSREFLPFVTGDILVTCYRIAQDKDFEGITRGRKWYDSTWFLVRVGSEVFESYRSRGPNWDRIHNLLPHRIDQRYLKSIHLILKGTKYETH